MNTRVLRSVTYIIFTSQRIPIKTRAYTYFSTNTTNNETAFFFFFCFPTTRALLSTFRLPFRHWFFFPPPPLNVSDHCDPCQLGARWCASCTSCMWNTRAGNTWRTGRNWSSTAATERTTFHSCKTWMCFWNVSRSTQRLIWYCPQSKLEAFAAFVPRVLGPVVWRWKATADRHGAISVTLIEADYKRMVLYTYRRVQTPFVRRKSTSFLIDFGCRLNGTLCGDAITDLQ